MASCKTTPSRQNETYDVLSLPKIQPSHINKFYFTHTVLTLLESIQVSYYDLFQALIILRKNEYLTYPIYTVLDVTWDSLCLQLDTVLNSHWYDVCTDFYHTADRGRSYAFIGPYSREPAAFIYAKAGSSISSVNPATQTIGNVLFQFCFTILCKDIATCECVNVYTVQKISLTSARQSSTPVNDASAVTHYPIGTIDTCLGPTLARGSKLP